MNRLASIVLLIAIILLLCNTKVLPAAIDKKEIKIQMDIYREEEDPKIRKIKRGDRS